MTELEFLFLLFGLIIFTLIVGILMCIIIFKRYKKHYKKLSTGQFNRRLSQNKKMIEAENILNKK